MDRWRSRCPERIKRHRAREAEGAGAAGGGSERKDGTLRKLRKT